MLIVETIRKVRQAHFRDGKGTRDICREFNLARNTVRNIIRSGVIDQVYERNEQPRPKLGSFIERLAEANFTDEFSNSKYSFPLHKLTIQLAVNSLRNYTM